MEVIAPIVYQSAGVRVEAELPSDATLGVFAAIYGNKHRLKVSLTRMADSDRWIGTLNIPKDQAIGEYQYQVWSDEGVVVSGVFSVVAGFSADGVTNTQTPNEQRLAAVQKAIDRLMATGIKAYGISGSFTTRMGLSELYKERYRLTNLVNMERRDKGLPFLRGTTPAHTTQFLDY